MTSSLGPAATAHSGDASRIGSRAVRLRTIATVLVLLLVVAGARVRSTNSDPRVTLLTSQALIETGSPRLDRFLPPEVVEREQIAAWVMWHHAGAVYNFYPPGPAVLAIPVVAAARAVGLDMVRTADDAKVQVLLAALLVAGIFVVFEATARLWLSPALAWATALVFVLGTSITSTVGGAYWSHGPLVLLGALGCWHVSRAALAHREPSGIVLGLLLGAGFWCRPTAVIPAFLVMGWLVVANGREALRCLAVLALLVGALVGASWVTLGQPFPAYYLPATWPSSPEPWIGLAGLLVSPGRGLWCFSPILLVGVAGWCSSRLRRDPLFVLAAAWASLQLVVVARNVDWWGGWCFGPRLLADSLPAWLLMLVLVLGRLREHWPGSWRGHLLGAVLVLASGFSIAVHSVQGLYNPATYFWNDRPDVYLAPTDKLFDLSNPQFLASWGRNDDAAMAARVRTP